MIFASFSATSAVDNNWDWPVSISDTKLRPLGHASFNWQKKHLSSASSLNRLEAVASQLASTTGATPVVGKLKGVAWAANKYTIGSTCSFMWLHRKETKAQIRAYADALINEIWCTLLEPYMTYYMYMCMYCRYRGDWRRSPGMEAAEIPSRVVWCFRMKCLSFPRLRNPNDTQGPPTSINHTH